VQAEGHFSGGSVTVRALPLEVLGPDNMHTWPLRRLEGLVSPQELEEHVGRELSKVCCTAAAVVAADAASGFLRRWPYFWQCMPPKVGDLPPA
jgi:hypothetical protein